MERARAGHRVNVARQAALARQPVRWRVASAFGSPRIRTWTTGEGEDRSILEIVADEIGPSLRWATTEVTRTAAR